MSQKLISLSPDLACLQGEGYDIDARQDGYLVVRIPYVDSAKKVKWGILVSELTLAGDVTTKPSTHVVHFGGDYPCRKDGSPITEIQHQSQTSHLAPDLVVNHSFSSKPSEGYKDYYEKMTTYCAIISSHAQRPIQLPPLRRTPSHRRMMKTPCSITPTPHRAERASAQSMQNLP